MKYWSAKQIKQHTEAALKLGLIKQEFHSFIFENRGITEKEGLEFIEKAYKKHRLVNDNAKEFAIVAFGKNTNQVHYFPSAKSLKLKSNTLILLDIWARLPEKNAPYADATFMFFKGTNIPIKIQKAWKVLAKSRDRAIEYMRNQVREGTMPQGLDVDRVAHDIIGDAKLGHGIKHTIGHSLGLDSPHGKLPGINWREYSRLRINVGYTIEPGIYLENWGLRTEIDFYINNHGEVIITTPMQDDIEIMK